MEAPSARNQDEEEGGYRRDEFGRSVGAISQLTASMHKNTDAKRFHYGNQNPPAFSHRTSGGGLESGSVVHGKISRIESYGAFCDFKVQDPSDKTNYRGLIHISQLENQRVEKVEDIVSLQQEVYALILEVTQGPPGREKIRLSLKNVDQRTGELLAPPPSSSSGGGEHRQGGSDYQNFRFLSQRAKQRREMFRELVDRNGIKWYGRDNPDQPPPSLLRLLWSPSPEPPAGAAAVKRAVSPTSDQSRQKKVDYMSSSSSSSSESESESESEDSRDRKRRRRSSRDRRPSKNKNRRRRRSHKRRSSSSSSSTIESSESESESSSDNKQRDKKRPRQEPEQPEEDAVDEETLREAQEMKMALQTKKGKPKEDDSDGDDDDFGPAPLPQSQSNAAGGDAGSSEYGKALLPGEGQALAQYVQRNLRIPRRGEIVSCFVLFHSDNS